LVTTPLHEQISADIRRRIVSGDLAVGAQLPSEAELAARWRGSRAPVRQAMAALRAEGLIGGGQGRRPVVRRRSVSQPFDTFVSFSSWAEGLGHRPGQRTAEVALRPATAEVADRLDVVEGDRVVDVLRLRLLDEQPTMVERTTFTYAVGRMLLDFDCDSGSIYAYLTGRGLEVGVARHAIDAVGADATDAALLGLDPGAPLLRERRLVCTADGAPFDYSDDRYRSDLVSFAIDNHPDSRPTLARTGGPAALSEARPAGSHQRRRRPQ
jgi:GntR family transcriptional regulator